MKQQLQDLLVLIKSDRRTQVIGALIVCALLYLAFGESSKHPNARNKKPVAEVAQGTGASAGKEAYTDLVQRFSSDLKRLEDQSYQTKVALEQQSQQSKEYEARTAEIFKRMLEQMSEQQNGPGGASAAAITPQPMEIPNGNGPAELAPQTGEPDQLEALGFEDSLVAPPPAPAPKRLAVVGAGDSVRVKLLAGVNAPTDGTPYPVVFKLTGDVAGPDSSSLALGEARLIAAAQGSLTDSRALFRLSSLNIRFPNGRRKIVPVDGWVVGEDGIRGMEGVLIDPLGKVIAGAGIAGGLDGLGRALSDNQITRRRVGIYGTEELVTGSEATYAGGRALSGASREWASIIRERANEMVPHVSVLSGREATAVFSKSFTIPDLIEAVSEDSNVGSSID